MVLCCAWYSVLRYFELSFNDFEMVFKKSFEMKMQGFGKGFRKSFPIFSVCGRSRYKRGVSTRSGDVTTFLVGQVHCLG